MDPSSGRVGELPDLQEYVLALYCCEMKGLKKTYHDTAVPAFGVGRSNAGCKGRGGYVAAARGIAGQRGFADDELVLVDAVRRDFKEGGAGVLAARGGEQAGAVGVLRLALCRFHVGDKSTHRGEKGLTVIELDVVPVDRRANSIVDCEVATSRISLLEPRSDGCVGDDVLRGRELSSELRGEGDEPVDSCRSTTVEGAEVLVVNLAPE